MVLPNIFICRTPTRSLMLRSGSSNSSQSLDRWQCTTILAMSSIAGNATLTKCSLSPKRTEFSLRAPSVPVSASAATMQSSLMTTRSTPSPSSSACLHTKMEGVCRPSPGSYRNKLFKHLIGWRIPRSWRRSILKIFNGCGYSRIGLLVTNLGNCLSSCSCERLGRREPSSASNGLWRGYCDLICSSMIPRCSGIFFNL